MFVQLKKDIKDYGKKGDIRHLTIAEGVKLLETGDAKELQSREVVEDGSSTICLRDLEDRKMPMTPRSSAIG